DPTQKPQISGHQLFRIVGNKNPLDIKLHAGLVIGLIEIHRGLCREIEQSRVLHGPFGLSMKPEKRILPVARYSLVKLLVILVLQFALGPFPERAGGIDLLRGPLLDRLLLGLVPFALVRRKENRKRDMVRILANNLPQLPAVGVFFALFIEIKSDGSPLRGALGGLDLKPCLAIARPAPGALFRRLP